MDLDLEELAAVVELLDKTDFMQFRFEKGDLRIAVSRGGPLDEAGMVAPQSRDVAASQGAVSRPAPTKATPPVRQSATASLDEDEVAIRAPMLGSFYRSPKPGEAQFVEVGDKVDPDTVVCIVEVMKLMNSVPAGVSGEVTRVFARDGDLIEFDQPIFAVRVAA
ncbi:acetyl-CoA carboxylase biotin carboxyl carrier protein [Micromonospora globispora]|uniref:acetyl-CoA carboxylase biotin carboxyl carrier protein n=1 Tax=Micromonospora globispora TaxID=1450148 RepID=UPI000D6EB6FC|nr:acetyl-CoA carboxylase biotin carboxyl carrier protein [Micromonospora globispora]PWU55447.1 acetyl-CoA carboxylase biotin carboxyl carrier protein [Micromonospora globispora]RQW91846.1 acetyl-CoA carboxylase biotin carboxyl carrier protein [Micromonospora globispora]